MEGNLKFTGDLAVKVIRTPRVGIGYKLCNFPNIWRGWWRYSVARLCGIPTFYGTLRARLLRADGSVLDYGLIGTRAVTTAWVTAVATYMYDGSTAAPTAYDYHDSGVGTTAENASDTDIETTDGEDRVEGTPTNPSAGLYRSVGTISYTTSKAITEHGVFSAATAGTLLDRSVFSAINVTSGDSIQFTYTLTLTAGG